MKKIFLIFVLATLVSNSLLAQSPYQLEVEQHVSDTTLFLDFFIKKTSGADFKLGSSNFAVFITTPNLKADRMFKVDSLDGIWNVSFDPNSYLSTSVGGNGFVNLTVYKRTSGSGLGQPVTSTRGRIGRVGIPISNPCGTNTCSWIITPVAINNFANQNIKAFANFTTPIVNLPLCNMPANTVLTASQGNIICPNQPVLLSSTAPQAGQRVEWYRNNQLISSASQSTYLATQGGSYSVRLAQCIACTSAFQTIALQELALPPAPQIVQLADTLMALGGQNHKWYRNNTLITGATQPTYTPTQAGTYKVCSSNECGQVYSSDFVYSITSLSSSRKNQFNAQLFPNPYSAQTLLTLEIIDNSNSKIEVYNTIGERIGSLNSPTQLGKASLSLETVLAKQPAGAYFISIKQKNKFQTLKIVKI